MLWAEVWGKFQLEQLRPLFPGTPNEKKFSDPSGLCLSLRSPYLLAYSLYSLLLAFVLLVQISFM